MNTFRQQNCQVNDNRKITAVNNHSTLIEYITVNNAVVAGYLLTKDVESGNTVFA